MAVIERNEVIAPFFGKPMHFIKGQGPLGLQNTSEACFALLLPGLNNVTARIRYYSFCCWLLEEYAQRVGSTNPASQRAFIRKAELIAAFVNRASGDDSIRVPGSLYANRMLKEDSRVYDLKAGTYNEDGSTEHTYWKDPGGAFGQYYTGSLQDIGLISLRSGEGEVYVRTPVRSDDIVSGQALASAFDANIKPANKKIFFNSLNKEKLAQRDFDTLLEDFNLMDIPRGSEERALLIKMLLQKDYPLWLDGQVDQYRRETILFILSFAQREGEVSDRAFTVDAYQKKGLLNGVVNKCLTGWYYYQFNEYWHYGCQGVFNGLLSCLEETAGGGWMGLYQLIEQTTVQTVAALIKQGCIGAGSDLMQTFLEASQGRHDETSLREEIIAADLAARIAWSMRLLLVIYVKNKDHLQRLKSFGTVGQVERDGDCVTYYQGFERYLTMPVAAFLTHFFLSNTIYRHQYVAFRKMRGSSLSTQLFILEDGNIRKLSNNFEPGFTTPRVERVIQFLIDLGILNHDTALTDEGHNLLKQLTSDAA